LIHVLAAVLAYKFLASYRSGQPYQCYDMIEFHGIRTGTHDILGMILTWLSKMKKMIFVTSLDIEIKSALKPLSFYYRCSMSELMTNTIFFVVKCLLFCASAQLGCTLQPIGITGGIACGKSTVSKIFQEMIAKRTKDSISFIDIDAIAHGVLVPKESDTAYWKIVEAFSGDDILEETNGYSSPRNIDRRKLGDIIFKDASKRRLLNSLTHPLISKIMFKKIVSTSVHLFRRNAPFVLVDIPLLFEAGLKMKLLFGVKIVVATPHYLQLNRLIKRNPELSVQQCEDRISSQMPVIKKVKMADMVIWNSQTMSFLEKEVEKAFAEILTRKRGYLGLSLIQFTFLGLAIHLFDLSMIWIYSTRV